VVAIINPSYFGSQAALPIDKIDIIVLKYWKPLKGGTAVCVELRIERNFNN
jgi:hypothetical protein